MSQFTATPPPLPNTADVSVIDKLAEFVVKNGASFEQEAKVKERSNPKFAFLFGGDGYNYYQWKLASLRNALQDAPPDTFTAEESQEFHSLLDNLSGTKDSIKSSKDWIIQHPQHSVTISFALARKAEQSDITKRLHILYLINDVLYHSMKLRSGNTLDPFSAAVQSYLPKILQLIYHNSSQETQEKVNKVLWLWSQRTIFQQSVLDNFESVMKSPLPSPPPSTQPQPQAHQAAPQTPVPVPVPVPMATPPQQYAPPLMPQPQSHPLPPPPMMPPQMPMPQQLNRTVAVTFEQIFTYLKNNPSFPPYTPINPLNLPQTIDTHPTDTKYLNSKLEEFYSKAS